MLARAIRVQLLVLVAFAALSTRTDAGKLCSAADPTFCCEVTKVTDGDISMTLTLTKTGLSWVAFGISPNASMIGTDAFIFWPNTTSTNNSLVVSNRKAVARVMPMEDGTPDVFLLPGSTYNPTTGQLVVNFARLGETGDDNDVDFKAGNQTYAFVYRVGTPPSPNTLATIEKHTFTDIVSGVFIEKLDDDDDMPKSSSSARPAATSAAPAASSAAATTAASPAAAATNTAGAKPGAATKLAASFGALAGIAAGAVVLL
ncbi:hypothetical protein M427DRAFT_60248 [Gonapodya prolifera JEL478]|uniref:DOMON domain-containing protein n=1 Tax=Gonapodya prolifera (strain JEL478) TaxID=1344416 RepID=A0A139A4R6_GONPJ|nr:hypothetical protein M427DRAFT_60248 [Gonapodya prolifera JEL478]|eukprot:KXS11797.1 hypothetical protein M427DRAFT_60248 [Gonapodya prolifera JEL478]